MGSEEGEGGVEVGEVVAVYWGLLDGHLVGVMVHLGSVPGQFQLVVSV